MRRIILILFCMLINTVIYGQEDDGKIKLTAESVTDNEDLKDVLLFEGIEGYKLNFSGSDLIDKHYILTVKELWNGNISNVDTIMDSSYYNDILKIKEDSFQIKIISKKLKDDRLKVMFTFPKVRTVKYHSSTSSEDYSLRNLANQKDFVIESGKPFYLLSYIMPYEENGIKNWCTVDRSGFEVEKWGKEFGLEHYLVYEMKFK